VVGEFREERANEFPLRHISPFTHQILPTLEYERPVSAANSKTASREQRIRGHEQSRALDAITKTFMLRRLQKDVLKSTLPPRHELLLFCRPSKQQCELYRGIARRGMGSAVKGGGATAEALTVLTSLRKLCCHPSLAQDSKVVLAATDISSSGKLEILCALLEAARKHTPNDKVVIVSSFTSALSIIEETIIKPHGWPYHRLDGSTAQSERQSSVDSFNRASSSKAFVFLLSSKAGGCGLNMVGGESESRRQQVHSTF
jgi:SNF2 family DNA or RNA helicase